MATKPTPGAEAKNQGTGASAPDTTGQNATVQPTANAANPPTAAPLEIPVLGAAAAPRPQPVLQEGEDPAALGGHGGNQNTQAAQSYSPAPPAEPQSMADVQAMMDSRGSQAINRPAIMRNEREQESQVPPISMDIPPLSRGLDSMQRPDQFIEPVPDMARFHDHVAELAFLEEMVIIRIHETNEPGAEDPVMLGVNGRHVYIKRGQDSIVRRKYVEQLLRAKPENVSTRTVRTGDGDVRNIIDKTRALKYPFAIIRDDNPRGRAWEQRIRREG